jgi:hypothetical protein
MSDRSCPTCKHVFKYPSLLKIHFKNSYHCLLEDDKINNYFTNINVNLININTYKCDKCLHNFTNIKALNRHKKETKCGKTQANENTTQLTNSVSNEDIIKFIKKLNPKLTKNIEKLIDNTLQINNNNNDNHIVNQTNIINNNTINNNTTIIQHINPFGFEDVRTIPIPEMKAILNSGERAGFQIIKAIYNKIENKNFYKPNMSRPEIACLNTEFNLTIYKSREFCDALFDRCIAFLHHMLFLCKNEYSKNSIKNIYENIEYIETTMRTEIYDKQLENIIESEFRNNNLDNKDRIKKFIKDIKDNIETQEQSKSLINNILLLNNDSSKEYKITITDEDINKVLGDPKIIIGLNKQELREEFHFKRYEETKFYKFWTDRIKNEITYINKCKTATIGDIKTIKTRRTKIELMLNIIKARADNLKAGDLIDLDVDGFIYEVDDDDDDNNDNNDEQELIDVANLRDLENFTELEIL